MLNVLWDLAESLRKGNVRMASVHRNYTKSPAKPGIRVFLTGEGRVSRMEMIRKEKADSLYHWQPDNQKAFPSGNLSSICIGSSDKGWMKEWEKKLKAAPAMNAEAFLEALQETGFRTKDKPKGKKNKGEESLKSTAPDVRALLAPFLRGADSFREETAHEADNPAVASVLAVADRLERALESGTLYEDLKRAFVALCESDLESGLAALPLFAGKGEKSGAKIQVFFDLDVHEAMNSPYANLVQEELGRVFLFSGDRPDSPGIGRPDAYGLDAKGCDEKLGKANLEVLGPRYLYSLNSDLPALGRYGQISGSAFCFGGEARQRIKDAVEWIVDRNREGKTWARIQRFCGYDNGILCAYVEDPGFGFLGESLANSTVWFLCPPESDEDGAPAEETPDSANPPDGEIWQTVRTQSVIAALKGVVAGHPAARIRTFVLANVDPGRTRAMVERSIPGSEFIAAAERWQEGAANIPSLMPRIPLSLGEKFRTKTGGMAPRPSEVTCLLDQRWLRDGLDWSMGSGSAFADGIDLLLGRASVARLLRLAVENGSGLLAEWSRVVHLEGSGAAYDFLRAPVGKPSKPKKMGFNRTEWLAKFPALLGILLAASGRRKETYMKDAPYLIGQLLAAADRLHERYCRRDNPKEKLPSKLLGNSLVVTAGRNPQRALAMLQERFPIYKAWADGEGDGLGLWAANHFGEVAEKLAETGIPDSMTDADRAELLLGYAAGISGKKAESTTESK